MPIVHTFNTQGVLDKNSRDNVNNTTYQRIFNKASIETFSHAIKDISWNEILSEMNDPETAYNKFLKLFTDLYDANFPLKKQKNNGKINKNKSPWITNCRT